MSRPAISRPRPSSRSARCLPDRDKPDDRRNPRPLRPRRDDCGIHRTRHVAGARPHARPPRRVGRGRRAPGAYGVNAGTASDGGITLEDVQGILVAIAPIVGTPQIVSASANITQALGFVIDLAVAEAEAEAEAEAAGEG